MRESEREGGREKEREKGREERERERGGEEREREREREGEREREKELLLVSSFTILSAGLESFHPTAREWQLSNGSRCPRYHRNQQLKHGLFQEAAAGCTFHCRYRRCPALR